MSLQVKLYSVSILVNHTHPHIASSPGGRGLGRGYIGESHPPPYSLIPRGEGPGDEATPPSSLTRQNISLAKFSNMFNTTILAPEVCGGGERQVL